MEIDVTKGLPHPGQKVMCFGHKTYCCSEDMDEKPDWHSVIFSFRVTNYGLKRTIPTDPEESILAAYEVHEEWIIENQSYPGYGANEHVIGVTKWKDIENGMDKSL